MEQAIAFVSLDRLASNVNCVKQDVGEHFADLVPIAVCTAVVVMASMEMGDAFVKMGTWVSLARLPPMLPFA